MDFLFNPIAEILRSIVILILSSISDGLHGGSDVVSTYSLATTPSAWNFAVYSFVKSVSDNVILPIGALMLTFVSCYELLQMIIAKNNMGEMFVQDLVKWIMKTSIGIVLLSNIFTFVEAIFELSSEIVTNVASLSGSSVGAFDLTAQATLITDSLDAMNIGELTVLIVILGVMGLGFSLVRYIILPLLTAIATPLAFVFLIEEKGQAAVPLL